MHEGESEAKAFSVLTSCSRRNTFSLSPLPPRAVQFFTLLKNFSHRKQNVIYYLFIFLMCEEKNERQKFCAALDDAFVMRCGNALGGKVPVGFGETRAEEKVDASGLFA
jgi:hypothetical protein